MTVSFVVIAYNEERTIARTLASIVAQKDLADFEIILVNDGSRDATLQAVQDVAKKHPQIHIVDQANQGRGAARAAGVAAARGDYIAFVDADIILPPDWLSRCMRHMTDYDAAGGIAVPDGDVAFVYNLFDLPPKVTAHTVSVTGSNGLFKRKVFDVVSFDPTKRNGEDVAFNRDMRTHGITTLSVSDLVVEHRESKTYKESLRWLYQSGVGASRQLYEQPRLRLPDLAFFGFVGVSILSIAAAVSGIGVWWLAFPAVLAYLTLSSVMHLQGKFLLAEYPVKSLLAVFVNETLLFCYYVGRCKGLITEWRR